MPSIALGLMIPQNAIGQNMQESRSSPPREETMALNPKARPPDATFILLMMNALKLDPITNARSEATVVLGTIMNRESKLAATALLPSSIGAGSRHTRVDIKATNALKANARKMTSLALRYP